MKASFLFHEIHRAGHPIRRVGFDHPNAEFGKAHFRTLFRAEHRRRRDVKLAGDIRLCFARRFAKFLRQCGQFLFCNQVVGLHVRIVNKISWNDYVFP